MFDKDCNVVKNILRKNEFPPRLIDKHIKEYLNDRMSSNENDTSSDPDTPRYFKLPFLGSYSLHVDKKIKRIIKRFCNNDTSIKIIFTPFKSSRLFSTKDPIPTSLRSFVVYKFICGRCNSSYIGETTRHFNVRIKEHLGRDKQSHVYKHILSSPSCRAAWQPFFPYTVGSIINRWQYQFFVEHEIEIFAIHNPHHAHL